MRWSGHVARIGQMNVYNFVVGKTEGKTPLGRSRRRWEHSIRMYHREMWWEGADYMHLAQDIDL
jgi:hypothetical protein